jgi:hypothetical protein
VDAVEAALASDPDVERFAHLTKNDALAEFRRILADHPEVFADVTTASLPESFRVVLRDDGTTFTTRMEAQPGVWKVVLAFHEDC